ncbi:unnamed protein product, partial [Didymodactylos carnosus]
FDIGMGAEATLNSFNNTDQLSLITNIFITHYHGDHTGGIPGALNLGYLLGRKNSSQAIAIHGADNELLYNLTQGMRHFYAMDTINRQLLVDFPRNICTPTFNTPTNPQLDPTIFDSLNFVSTPFDPPPLDNKTQVIVYQNKKHNLTVKAFRVYHYTANPAVGYNIQYKNIKISISGDTVGYPTTRAILNAAKNADYLIHEVMNGTYIHKVVQSHSSAFDKFYSECQVYDAHTTIPQLATLAKLANVKNLILTHIVPSPLTKEDETRLKDAIAETYKGKIYIAADYDYWLV